MSIRKSTRRHQGVIRYQDEDYDVPVAFRRVPREVTTDFAPPSPPRVPSKRRRLTADPDFTPDNHDNNDDDDDNREPTPVDAEEVQELQQEAQEMQQREEDRTDDDDDGNYSDTFLTMVDEEEFTGLPSASPDRQSPDPNKIYPLGAMEMIEDGRMHYDAFYKNGTSYTVNQAVAVWYLDEQTKERCLGYAIIEQVYQSVGHDTVWLNIRWYMQVPDLGIVTTAGDTVNTHQLWYSEDYSHVSVADVERHIHVRLVSTRDNFRELDLQLADKPDDYYVCRSYDTQSGTFEQLASDHEEEEEEQLQVKPINGQMGYENPLTEHSVIIEVKPLNIQGDRLESIRNSGAQHQLSSNKSGDSRPDTADLRTGPLDARLRRQWQEAMPELSDNSEFMQWIQRNHVDPCMDIGRESAGDVGRRQYLNREVRSNTFHIERLQPFVYGECYGCESSKPCTHMIQFANDSHQTYNIGSHCAERLDAVRTFYEFIQHLRNAQVPHPNLILERRLQSMMKAMDRAYAHTMKL